MCPCTVCLFFSETCLLHLTELLHCCHAGIWKNHFLYNKKWKSVGTYTSFQIQLHGAIHTFLLKFLLLAETMMVGLVATNSHFTLPLFLLFRILFCWKSKHYLAFFPLHTFLFFSTFICFSWQSLYFIAPFCRYNVYNKTFGLEW